MALGDPLGILASPLKIIERCGEEEADIAAVAEAISESGAGKVIVGLPLSMDGTEGSQAIKVKDFADKLSQKIEVPLDYRDERLSTVSANRLLRQSGKKRGAKKPDDAAAAAVILQGYLDEAC